MTEQSQLEILCEVPLKVKIGDKNFEIRPLTFKKLIELKPHIKEIFETIGGLGMAEFTNENFLTPILDNVEKIIDQLLDAIKIILGDEKIEKSWLSENLDTLMLGKILGFIIKTCNIGETVKNVVILGGMAK